MLLMSGSPAIAALAPTRSPRWTGAITPATTRSPSVGRRCKVAGTPSAPADVGSGDDGCDSRSGDELRLQLGNLQEEAESARSKANSARMRLMRLSEVAEQLQKQAASKVRVGREDDARELLLQKKKIMLTLEKSKNRIELLDRLSAKLNEAILLKETELIGNVSSQSSPIDEDAITPVRVVPARTGSSEYLEVEVHNSNTIDLNLGNAKVMEPQNNQDEDSIEKLDASVDGKSKAGTIDADTGTFVGMMTYKGLLEHVDGQLESLQEDIGAFLRLSSLGLELELRQKNKYLQDMQGILLDISNLRERIVRINQTQSGGI